MSFFCSEECRRRPNTNICRPNCITCPNACYYRNQYNIDSRGRPFITDFQYPLPLNMPYFDFSAYGYFYTFFEGNINSLSFIPLSTTGTQRFINTQFPEVSIAKTGTYQINYLVNTSTGGEIALTNNLNVIENTRIQGNGVISDSTVINISVVPAFIGIVNSGAAALTMTRGTVNAVSAQLTISQVT